MLSDRAKALRPIIQAAFDAGGLDGVCEAVAGLIAPLEVCIEQLMARVAELEKRLNMNSSNSSKPPSSDGLKRKTKSLRRKNTGRKPGGQPGHTGQTLHQSPAPNIVHSIALDRCPVCETDLRDEPVTSEEKRQVFDLPPIAMEVSEHRAECKWCPACAKWVTAAFPAEVSAPVQYGHGMQSVMSYLNIAQLLPCERTADVCQDLFGHRPSAGSVVRAVARCAERVAPAVERIAGVLREAKQLHADETGVRCAGHTEWIHVASTATHTLYNHSPKRGREGFEAGGVLPNYRGNLITDFWGSYDTLERCDHSRCNAHLLRELTSFSEDGQRWAAGLIAALLAMKQAADDARQRGQKHIKPAALKPLLADYDRWIFKGLKAHPEVAKPAEKRGRAKQSKEHNLLERMSKKRDEVLRFAHDLDVPFDNNQAERDLRMIKVQQKVSGCFRSERGARMFCAIRSYLSTTRKHGLNLMDSIKSAFAGRPVDFAPE
jgi:transposase